MIKNFLNNEYFMAYEPNPIMITCIIYNYNIITFISELYEQLEKIKHIKNPKTRSLSNDRIYSLIQYIDKWDKEIKINHIFLIDKDVHEHKLRNREIGLLKEFNKNNMCIYFENKFKIDYLIDFFTNFNYYDVFECNRLHVNYINITQTKSKTIKSSSCKNEDDLDTFVSENKNNSNKYCVIHGQSTLLKKYQSKWTVFNKKLENKDIIDEIENTKTYENHKKLETVFDYINDERKLHLVIYGKIKVEIKNAIEEYRIKELYCNEERLSIVKKQLPNEYYNFPIIIIKKLKDGDISDKLLKDFKGAIGISYY
jgi:hypothetical protein